jgi:PAT family beta-lactamase induction signal transducer AmpG
MYICTGEYKTSHYAVSTGLMAFGKMFAEYISGPIQIKVGYPIFFIIVCLLTIPGMLTILFIPFNEERTRQKT